MAKNKDFTTTGADGTVLYHMAPKKKMRLTLSKRKALSGWLLVLPFVLGLIFVYGPILFSSLRAVFYSVEVKLTGIEYYFVGFGNIKWAFQDDLYFVDSLVNGFKSLLIQVPAIIIFSLFMAIILNQKMRGRAAFRAIFFLPVILSIGIIDTIDTNAQLTMAAITGGIDDGTGALTEGANSFVSMMDLSNLFANVQIGGGFMEIAMGLVNDIFNVVSRSGVQMLIFLSGLQSISPAIYESCQIDGASAWETFWKVTLPMISPMILVNSIYTLIDAFTASNNKVINHIFVNIGGNSNPINSMYEYVDPATGEIIHKLFSDNSLRTTEMWIYVVFISLLVVIVALLMKAFVFYQKRD